jgi:hypothetical protein
VQDTHLKLASVVTDIDGVSALAMVEAILAGARHVEVLERVRGEMDQWLTAD